MRRVDVTDFAFADDEIGMPWIIVDIALAAHHGVTSRIVTGVVQQLDRRGVGERRNHSSDDRPQRLLHVESRGQLFTEGGEKRQSSLRLLRTPKARRVIDSECAAMTDLASHTNVVRREESRPRHEREGADHVTVAIERNHDQGSCSFRRRLRERAR